MESRQPSIIRRVADAGYDHVFIDMEHTCFSFETVADFCEMARARDIVPIVRPSELTRSSTLRLLEIGALGVMFHDVDDREEVDTILDWTVRSKSAVRSDASKGLPEDALLIVIQIETAKGLEAVDTILEGGGVDMVEIGRGDLASDLGHHGQREHPEVQKAIDRIVAACTRKGIAVGVTCQHAADVHDMVRRGVRCLTYAGDVWFLRDGLRLGIETLKQTVPHATAE
jgi:4-hydroxy-2-oxoheptanedioate aldolase